MPLCAALELPGRGGSRAERLARADSALALARAEGAELAVMPEAYLPGYVQATAHEGDAARAWMEGAVRRHAMTIAMSYVDGDACLLGVTTPDGRHTTYQKRVLSPGEARVWRPGGAPVIVHTPIGRVGLLLCADVLQLDAWTPYVGRVDAVLVSAAWPDYRGRIRSGSRLGRPAFAWLFRESNAYRHQLLARAAQAVGAPVLFANASGTYEGDERFSGGSCVYGADGRVLAEGPVAVAPLQAGPPGAPLRHPKRWAAFFHVYRTAGLAAARAAV